jgi:hypothetical protein
MATILILTHERDRFSMRPFLVAELARHWREWGHRVLVHASPKRAPRADISILHVDLTVIPDEYVAAAREARIALNAGTADISKRRYSAQLVPSASAFEGAVLVKTNRNCAGVPEAFHRRSWLGLRLRSFAAKSRLRRPAAGTDDHTYRIYERSADVPERDWDDPELVVEKFLPERDEAGYYLRTWLFFGDRESCNRVRSASPIVKGRGATDRAPVPVPEELRARRRQLGFDYGKFDFVVRDGVPVLYDANRTPGFPPNLRARLHADVVNLAHGIDTYV